MAGATAFGDNSRNKRNEMTSNGAARLGASTTHSEANQSMPIDIMLIGEVAAHVGLEPKTIRFYERAKLLFPRKHGRIRIYRQYDVDNLLGIKKLRQYGIPIAKIRSILKNEGSLSLAIISSEPMQQTLQLHLEEMRKKHIQFLEQMEDLRDRLRQTCASVTEMEPAIQQAINYDPSQLGQRYESN
jgi:DNA-binding transcriptional MerR regulator